MPPRLAQRLAPLRRAAMARTMAGAFELLTRSARLHPRVRRAFTEVEVVRDLPYAETGLAAHTLDIYRPRGATGPLPIVVYIHGGGFNILSKDTHWVMGLAFARRGYLVFNVNYRLAPAHPFPAALEDIAQAYAWIVRHAAAHGGDVARLVIAGESAGANLASTLTIMATTPRPEPWAKVAFATGTAPVALVPMCGILQVTDIARFLRRRELPLFVRGRIEGTGRAYLHGHTEDDDDARARLLLADPLRWFESDAVPARPLPPTFITVGTRDPILDDSRRLHAALVRRGVTTEVRYYPGEVHAFQAFVWRRNAQDSWRKTFAFLDRHVPGH